MKAIILSAGRGSRLGPATEDRPKCLVRISGRSLLDRQTAALRAGGAHDIAIVVGWRRESMADCGLPTFVNEDWATTSMVETLACAASWLKREPVIVSYGDIVYSAATVRALAASRTPIAVSYDPGWRALWEQRFDDPLTDAETFELGPGGLLRDIGGRPDSAENVEGQYMGLLRLTPDGWHELDHCRSEGAPPAHMTGLLQRVVRAGRMPIAAVPVVGPWYEFDHPADLDTGRAAVDLLDAGGDW
ncbi:phosphocholine cytidylyltransferase family protein [Sphaerisporangium fuscum]|uniref:phosphocholine cytidylyltransferase family protein n=1 Tax=Sphaerisporangium fuscum TaxID=2835868 RepID=UPI001BDCC403|nr:phosphocholine cytidylyltransferase family protein [Sphaerisporangium fuscum]